MNTTQARSSDTLRHVEPDTEQYLTFKLAGEEYGVDILRVQEIRGWDTVTAIPNMPDYILGVINLRGTVVPIIDFRRRFNLDSIPFGPTTVVIVVRVVGEDGRERTMGMVVDAVSEVYDVPTSERQPAPDFGGAISVDSISGLVTLDDKMIILLDIDHLVNSSVISTLQQAAH